MTNRNCSGVARIGIVTGLKSEARLLAGALTKAVGGQADQAQRAARHMVADKGARGLVSFGIAAGLDPALMSGDLVLGIAVLRPDGGAYACDFGWRLRLQQRLEAGGMNVHLGIIAGCDRILVRKEEKQYLARQYHAAAADMESHGVAQAAVQMKVPLLVVRAISDSVDQIVPDSATVGIGPDGGTRPMAVLAGLMQRPDDFFPLLEIAREVKKAVQTLQRSVSFGGLDLAFPGSC